MYAPKFRYQKRTDAFYQDNDNNLARARSRTSLRYFSRQTSLPPRTLRRKTSSLGSIPVAVADGIRGARPEEHKRGKHHGTQESTACTGAEGRHADSATARQSRSRFALRSISVPSTPMHREDDTLPTPDGPAALVKAIHDRLGGQKVSDNRGNTNRLTTYLIVLVLGFGHIS